MCEMPNGYVRPGRCINREVEVFYRHLVRLKDDVTCFISWSETQLSKLRKLSSWVSFF